MKAIRILSKCAASGLHLAAGKVFTVPSEVSAEDAGRLVRMGRAVEVEPKPSKAKAEPKQGDAAPNVEPKQGDGEE